jgi:hypothetical protein
VQAFFLPHQPNRRAMVQKRHFFHTPGFDPFDVTVQYRRCARELALFSATWNMTTSISPLRETSDSREPCKGDWTVTTRAPGWQVNTDYEYLDWSDIVRSEIRRPWIRRLWEGAATFADIIGSGTAARYFKANWRYAIFFLVPFIDVILFAVFAAAAGVVAATALPSISAGAISGLAGGLAGALLAAGIFAFLLRWLGERWRIGQGVADWIFAREYMLGGRPDMEARIEAFADRLIACARRGDVDEIVVCGHSLGAIIVVDVVSRAFARDPDLGRHGPQLCLLTIGATIPKLALHPRGEWLRAKARRLADEPSLSWAEYQARDDIISFHKFDPVRLRRADDGNQAGSPVIRRVQIHQMLSRKTFRRFRFNYMRLHYQFVMANEVRTVYDHFMLMCGPAPFRRMIREPNGPVDLYSEDGSLRQSDPDPDGWASATQHGKT